MIRVAKAAKPAILENNEAKWTAEFLEARANGNPIPDSIRYRYRHPEVKKALRAEAHGKCVYCEAKLPIGETDHINPVTECPDQIVTWPNLCLSCKECNTSKSGYYSPAEPLINPFIEEPSSHLLFFGPLVMGKAGDAKGFRTVAKLKLSRTDLIQRRAERVQQLQPLVEKWLAHPDGPTKDLLKGVLLDECADSAEFTAVVRAYLYQELGWTYAQAAPSGATSAEPSVPVEAATDPLVANNANHVEGTHG
jgi:hypothetical protein